MDPIACLVCGATSECGEIENGKYKWTYDREMAQLCQAMQDRRQAGETSIPIACDEMDKTVCDFINKDRAEKSVQAAEKILATAMRAALAKDNAALAKAIQTAAASRIPPKSPRQKTKNSS